MTTDIELMTKVVKDDPGNETNVGILADALTDEGGDFTDNLERAKEVALRAAIDAFVKHTDKVVVREFAERGYTLEPPTHRAEYISDKWCKIITCERGGDRSVYCFVCLKNGYTRTLGVLTAGDIHKAASWRVPAKHARGNVFKDNTGDHPFPCAGPYGVAYLR